MAKSIKIAVIPLFLFLFLFGTVQSQAEYTTDKAAFMAKYPDLTKQDFSESQVPGGNIEGCPGPLTSSTNDACVTPGVILPELSFRSFGGILAMGGPFVFGVLDNPNHSLVTDSFNDTFVIDFQNGSANVVGLQIGCLTEDPEGCRGGVNVQSIGPGDVTIGTFDLQVTDSFGGFLGISRGEGILSVRITPDPDNPFSIVAGVDAVYFGFFRDVPTISEWGMIATVAGLGIIGFAVLRRRKSAVN